MTAPTPRGERPTARTLVPLPALTGAVCAVAVAGAVSAAPSSVRTPLAWGTTAAAVVLVVAVFTAVHAAQSAHLTRRRLFDVVSDAERLVQERDRAVEETQRERQHLVDELARQRAEFAEVLAEERAHLEDDAAHALDHLTRENARLAAELERATRAHDTAVAATAHAAGRMQALTTAMLADLRAMEERHTNEDVLADLLHLDHRTAQAGRLADSVAVLAGARSGRRWARPIAMESVLRGAMGRISAYRRIRVHATGETCVAGHAAEGVMHALAELLDNAANFSPPASEVHVYVEEVPAGVIVSVEDSGLVMGEVQLRRAEQAVSGDVSGLGGLTGTRLGLAVVGLLARKYGLKVSFRPSARGGTGALVLIPQSLLTSPAAAAAGSADAAPLDGEQARPETPGDEPPPAEAPPAAGGALTGPPPVHESADAEADERSANLPKRRRGHALAEAERARPAPRTPAPRNTGAARDVKARAARFNSFRQAVRSAAPDQATPPGAATRRQEAEGGAAAPSPPADRSPHPHAHPEGDATR